MKNAFLKGERIYLRPIEREDAPQLQSFMNDPEVTQTLQMHRPLNLQVEQDFIEHAAKDQSNIRLAIALKQEDALIGATDLRLGEMKDRKAEFGIAIGAKDEWNKGYGTEATKLMIQYGFETLNLNRIFLRVYEYNPRAMKAYEKAGFKREGVLRDDTYRMGRYWDAMIMGLLREDWKKLCG
jgi:[ribosomal protein S5]-alanine N-acetyltransferase